MRNVIEYVLQDQKVKDGFVDITGPYSADAITWDNVYRAFLDEKRLWHKDSGRMYAHNIISFHRDEKITPAECMEIGRQFVDKFFSEHQSLISIHQDKDHLHIHIVTNSVSYVDGLKLHQTKRDLEQQKRFTNELCCRRGLSVAKKRKHFDGTIIEEGEIIGWKKDKYNLLVNDSRKSYVAECAMAVLEAKEGCCSKDDFIRALQERGWYTVWTDSRKHITFQNENGDKVRDSNLSKTFEMKISKEELMHEFERQNEIRIARLKADRDREQYYTRVEEAIQGKGSSGSGDGQNNESSIRDRADEAGRSREDTASFIRELQSQERASAQKRDDSIAERADREAARERYHFEAERAARASEQRVAAECAGRKRRSRSYDIDR